MHSTNAFMEGPTGERIRSLGWTTLLCLTLMITTLATAQPAVTFEQYKLDNGMTVILHEDHSAPVAAVVVMYHVGSKNEKLKRTGFAHLFEHMMFQGSQHIADNEHFKLLQEVGANINGTTNVDRTNYFEVVPSNYVELAIYLEADRMGFLLPAMTQEKLDNQRDVVKNERRQSYDNVPYGTATEKISKALFPENHPYSWPTIGSMDDLSAASLEDIKEFFKIYYAPNNAVISVAGDFKPAQVKEWIQKYFGPFKRGTDIVRPEKQDFTLAEEKRMTFEDRVQLPRLYMAWPSAPMNTREDAVLDVLTDILSAGKTSRLYKTMVYDKQIAQSVSAYQNGMEIGGMTGIQITAKPGKTLSEMEKVADEELQKILKDGVTEKEIQMSLNWKESSLINSRSTVLGKANSLATYFTLTGDPNNFNKELARFDGITPEEVQDLAKKIYTSGKVVLSVVPQGKTDLAAERQTIEKKGGVE